MQQRRTHRGKTTVHVHYEAEATTGEFSSSKINKLAIANIADASEPRNHGENNVGTVCLPSIKSLMVSPEVYENTKSLPVP